MANYYASPSGLSSNSGTIGSPWDLQTALSNGSQTSNDTLWLRGGTYLGKFQSELTGGTVRGYPGEWAVIDGYYTTTLNGAIDSSQTTFALADASRLLAASPGVTEIWIDDEVIHVFGKSGNNITQSIRGYNSTSAASHANGATVKLAVNYQFTVTGSNTTYLGFEVTTSLPNRSNIYQFQRGAAVSVLGTGNSFINLILHDCTVGIFTGSSTGNTLIYGCLIYNNGVEWDIQYGNDEPRGLNMYLENASGYSRVYEVLNLNSFTNGGNYFGVSAAYVGGDTQGSVFANAGAPIQSVYPSLSFPALWVGTGSVKIDSMSIDQSYFWLPDANGSSLLNIGYGAGMTNGSVTDSIFVGALTGVELNPDVCTFTGNIIDVNRGGTSRHLLSPGTTSTIDNNTYYHAASPATSGWFYYGAPGHTTVDFTQWKADSPYDDNSTASASAIPDMVIVRPNFYEIGRAHIIVFTSSSPTSINVDLSNSGLVDNQNYVIKNAFNYFGSNVATGVYDAGSPTISLSLNSAAATAVATPTGMGSTADTTLPNFGAFVVVPGTVDLSAPGQPTNFTVTPTRRNGTTGTIEIAWTLADETETSVVLTRVLNGTPTEIVLGADVESYTDTGLTIGATYTYYVRAENAAGGSESTDPIIRVMTGLTSFGSPPSISN